MLGEQLGCSLYLSTGCVHETQHLVRSLHGADSSVWEICIPFFLLLTLEKLLKLPETYWNAFVSQTALDITLKPCK